MRSIGGDGSGFEVDDEFDDLRILVVTVTLVRTIRNHL